MWEPWLLYVLRGVAETAAWTCAKIAGVRRLSLATTEYIRVTLPTVYSRELVETIFEQPYCRITNLVERGIAERRAASRYLKALTGAGVLREVAVNRPGISGGSTL